MNTMQRASEIRLLTLECINSIGSGHVGGCLSIADALACIYTNHMRFDVNNPKKPDRDKCILSKGHAGPALYATLCSFGFFGKELLLTLNRIGTKLPSHCNDNLTPGVDMTAGSLGQGISSAVGVALASKLKNDGSRVFCIVGDGECQEGQVWEAIMLAANKQLDNLTLLIDDNAMQIDGYTSNINNIESIGEKLEAFGWDVLTVDGHDHEQLESALSYAQNNQAIPTAIVMKTLKGKGVSFYEDMGYANHSTTVTDEQLALAKQELSKEGE